MGNLLNIIVSAVTEEIINKIKSLGYHTYNIDYENNFTIEGIRSNPKCKMTMKKTSICAAELFTIENVSIDGSNRVHINLKIPTTVLKIGRASFSCSDPELYCNVKGTIQIVDVHFTLTIAANITNNIKLDHVTIKPKVTEIKSELQVIFNKKDCSEAANSVLRSQDPVMLNFILDLIFKSQEEPIKDFINNLLKEMQKSQVGELF